MTRRRLLKRFIGGAALLAFAGCGSGDLASPDGTARPDTEESPIRPPARAATAPTTDLAAPTTDLAAPTTDLAAPTTDLAAPTTDLAAPTTDLAAPTTDLAAPTTDLAAPTTDLAAPTTDLAAPTTDLAAPTTDLAAPTTDLAAPTTDLAAPTTDVKAVEKSGVSSVRPLEAYGFQAHLFNQDRSLIVRLTKEAGFDWLKQQVVWFYTEPDQKGVFDWRELDKVVAAVRGSGLRFLISVVRAPAWALGDRENGPPADLADFRDFMEALAGRYRGDVHAYEIWNEANLSREWGYGRLNAGEFVELLGAGYQGVKVGDPDAIVVGGALTPAGDVDVPDQKIQAIDDVRFLRQMYEYKDGAVKGYFDVWGVHPGGFNNAPDQPMGSDRGSGWNGHHSFYFLRFTEHRAVMQEFGEGGKPIWFTEFGWSTENLDQNYGFGKDNSEQDQADFLVRAFDLVRNQYPYVTHLFVWNLNFQMVVPPTDEKYPFGVVFSDGSSRPAYEALRAMDKGR